MTTSIVIPAAVAAATARGVPVGDLADRERTADEGTRRRPIAARCSTASRPTEGVVGPTRGEAGRLGLPVDEDDGRALRAEVAQAAEVVARRVMRSPRPGSFLEQDDVGLLTLGGFVAVAHEHGEFPRGGGVLDPSGHVGEERVARVEHHQAEGWCSVRRAAGRAWSLRTKRRVRRWPAARGSTVRGATLSGRLSTFETVPRGHTGERRDLAHTHRHAVILTRRTGPGSDPSGPGQPGPCAHPPSAVRSP